MIRDSHTSPTQRLEIILLTVLLICITFLPIWPIYAAQVILGILMFFLIITIPFQVFIDKRVLHVLWISLIMLLARAVALGAGFLNGYLQPLRTITKAFPCQSTGERLIKRLLDVLGAVIELILLDPLIGCTTLAPVLKA